MKKLLKYTVIGLVIYAALHILIHYIQGSLLYHPYKAELKSYNNYNIVQIEKGLYSLYHLAVDAEKPIIVFLHGNAGNVYHRISKATQFIEKGYGVLLVEYTGYGFNEGVPREQTLYKDAKRNIDWLIKQNNKPLILYTESLGTGIGIDYLSKHNTNRIKALILETPYDSMLNVAHRNYPFILGKQYLLTEKYDSLSKIQYVRVPTLYLLALKDEVVGFDSGMNLYKLDKAPKQKIIFDNATHNTIYNFSPETAILDFIEVHTSKM